MVRSGNGILYVVEWIAWDNEHKVQLVNKPVWVKILIKVQIDIVVMVS